MFATSNEGESELPLALSEIVAAAHGSDLGGRRDGGAS